MKGTCKKTPMSQTTYTKAVLVLDVAVGKNGMVGTLPAFQATLLELPLAEATTCSPVGPPRQDSSLPPLAPETSPAPEAPPVPENPPPDASPVVVVV